MDSEPILNAATAASIEVTHEQPQPHKWLVAAAVLLGGILTILDGSIVNVALPYMQRSFGVGVDRISWGGPRDDSDERMACSADRTAALPAALGRVVRRRLGTLRARPGHRSDGGVP